MLISRRLVEPPIQALEQDEVAEGIAFMKGLVRPCEEDDDLLVFDVGESQVTVLRA